MSPAMQPRGNRQAGFTLLEVLVALSVLAAAMAAIGSLASVGRRANRAEAERVELAQVARRLMNELTERAFSSGTTGQGDGFAWRIEVEPIGPAPKQSETAAAFAPSAQFPFGRPGAPPQAVWTPYRVILRVTGPTGASTEIVTVRLGRAPS